MANNPYSYVVSGGVVNKRVRTSDADATLQDLYDQLHKPLELDLTAIEYHNGDKQLRYGVKKALPYFVGGEFTDSKRSDDSIKTRTMLTLDVEQHDIAGAAPPPPQEIASKLHELGGCGWVYTSISHTPDRPRYRVVLPLGKPIERGSDYDMGEALKASTLAAAAKLGIAEWCAPESYVLSQAMFLPAKLKGMAFYQEFVEGKAWSRVAKKPPADIPDEVERPKKEVADIPDERPDFILEAIKAAGLYIKANKRHPGMHFIKCPFEDEHGVINETQTVYYEAHFDGNPKPAVKCFDTVPDVDGKPHLSIPSLVRYLKDAGHVTDEQQAEAGVLDDPDAFDKLADIGALLDTEPVAREWAIEKFAPVGKVTVLAGPGGVSKSMMMLHVLTYAAMGQPWAGFKPEGILRSLYVSYEDDKQELHKRINTLANDLRTVDDGTFDMLYDVNSSIRKNLRVYAADDNAVAWLLATKPDRYSPAQRTARVDWLIGYIKSRGIKLLCLDPAVYTHQLAENDVADMAEYMRILTQIAKHAGCAVVVLHHMNKGGANSSLDDVTSGSLRGASSFSDNARSVMTVVSMPIHDAPTYGLAADHDTVSRYLVAKHTKHNYSGSMGIQVFERKGALLIPRTDILRLSAEEAQEARDAQKREAVQRKTLMLVPRALEVLMEAQSAVSQNFVAHEMNAKPATVKDVLQWCVDNDYVEMSEGPNRSRLHELNKNGKTYLKLLKKEAQNGR
jgi:hypothetical protein